jgi:hypothetical protein
MSNPTPRLRPAVPVRIRDREESTLALALLVVGAPRVALALACHEAFGSGPTMALALFIAGLVSYARAWQRR